MPITPGHIGTKNIAENTKVVIEMLTSRPSYGVPFVDEIKREPGQIVGFFNGTTGTVELYCVDNSGTKAIKIG